VLLHFDSYCAFVPIEVRQPRSLRAPDAFSRARVSRLPQELVEDRLRSPDRSNAPVVRTDRGDDAEGSRLRRSPVA
jgi:hypothetical protein